MRLTCKKGGQYILRAEVALCRESSSGVVGWWGGGKGERVSGKEAQKSVRGGSCRGGEDFGENSLRNLQRKTGGGTEQPQKRPRHEIGGKKGRRGG